MSMNKLAIVLAMAGAAAVQAAPETGTLSVGAQVVTSCAIGNASLSFENVSLVVNTDGTKGATAAATADTVVNVVCTNGALATITAGTGGNAQEGTRQMTDGVNFLPYELYTDGTRQTPLNGQAGIAHEGTGETTAVAIYGSIPADAVALAKAGSYNDTVTLTIAYEL